ncbi:DsbA family protein [Pseudomonas aeruginosa]|jgi:protein-disulfide isomerase|uniref:DsbA family protein n=1 Tax=Pseudomonas aeruginosa TaxID=287 RepID=UPI001AD9AA07|nr:thioredoxin domain-containing protein [Pseudomonas aeruginosa]MBO8337291.1 thioredoxin domain-containing protein [Pseudomonas aeruginosa]HCF4079496.1 thioredoxin domain-containing protein [Pseudomonas aeruginosa]
MFNPKNVAAWSLGVAISAAVVSGISVWTAISALEKAESTNKLANQVNDALGRVKPWAFSREVLAAEVGSKVVSEPDAGAAAPTQDIPAPRDAERRYGSPSAQFTLVEFSDFECSFCKEYSQVPKALVDGSRGNISVIFKHVPVHGEASRKAAFAAECAGHLGGNDAFFKMADAIFEDTRGNGNGTKNPLAVIADSIGLNGRELARCVDSDLYFEKVKSDFKEAVALDVKVTPTTVVRHNPTGKQTVVTGAVTPADLIKAMTELVAGTKK